MEPTEKTSLPEPRRKPGLGETLFEPPLPELSDVVSAGECTGLFPTPPQDAAALAALQSLYSMEIPKAEPS